MDVPKGGSPGCIEEAIGKNAFDVLMGCILAAQQSGKLPGGDPLPQAWTAWSLVHGIAKLAVSGNLPMGHAATLDFARRATEVLTSGLTSEKAAAR